MELAEGGYDGRIVVTIRQSDRDLFGTDWSTSDPTRFPARIRTATALLNCGFEGVFEVSHEGGSLAIRACNHRGACGGQQQHHIPRFVRQPEAA